MKNIQYQYLYLGAALGLFAELSFFNWEFYAIIAPFTILDSIKNYKK